MKYNSQWNLHDSVYMRWILKSKSFALEFKNDYLKYQCKIYHRFDMNNIAIVLNDRYDVKNKKPNNVSNCSKWFGKLVAYQL